MHISSSAATERDSSQHIREGHPQDHRAVLGAIIALLKIHLPRTRQWAVSAPYSLTSALRTPARIWASFSRAYAASLPHSISNLS